MKNVELEAEGGPIDPLILPFVEPFEGPELVPAMVKLRIEVGELTVVLRLLSIDVRCIELRPKRPMKLLIGFSLLVLPFSEVGVIGGSFDEWSENDEVGDELPRK